MRMDFKYIIVKDGMEIPVLFPETFLHSDFAIHGKVVSAGFVKFNPQDGTIICHGRSDSLGVESRNGVDAKLILECLLGRKSN